jgi:hypothetical protein
MELIWQYYERDGALPFHNSQKGDLGGWFALYKSTQRRHREGWRSTFNQKELAKF